ncbi:hypothetical protein JCM11641_006918 [Rhodosporidiobolus odoratus]
MSTPLRRRALSRSASISRNNPLLELVEQAGYQRTDPMLWRVLRLSLKRLNSNQWRNLQDRSNRRDNGKLQEQLKEMVNDLADFRSAEADRAAGEVEAFEEDSSDEDPANVAFHAVEDRVEEIKKLLSSKLADDWKHVWDREATILGLHLDPYAAHDLYNHPMKYEQIKLRHAIRDLALKDTDPVTCHVLVHALQHVQQSLSSYIVLHRERDHPGHARHPPIKELEERLQALHRELGEYRQHPAGLRDLIVRTIVLSRVLLVQLVAHSNDDLG